MPAKKTDPPAGLLGSPLYWLAVLRSARTSKDALLESDARKRLVAMGVRVIFDDEHTDAPQAKGGDHA